MYSKERARTLLGIVAACLLIADKLPGWQKLWFVAETGHMGSGTTVTALLLIGLYLRWRPARLALIGLIALAFLVTAFALSHPLPGHTLGYALTTPLRLLALAILVFSADIKQYLGEEPRRSVTF